ncbi:MAG: MlaD family protein [Saprospiraceae bacterium]|jgi:phospholipid/cholesterol/gamma-HCH transport system substrate-binding protein|nr:MlaD family protein [Saprospiraceae bacterium]
MDNYSQKFKIRLGLFILIGLSLFVLAIFIIGKQRNLFNPVFKINSTFYNVSGLQVGNNVRLFGINVGTVDQIIIINDSTVRVDMLIRTDVKRFIKKDSEIAIGSEGLIGDRFLIITQGSSDADIVDHGDNLLSEEPVETDAIMASLRVTAGNAEIISQELAEIMVKINSGKGTLGRLIQDSTISANFNQTMVNLNKSTKGLNENMEAVKHNFLLKGYFNKKKKEALKKKKELNDDSVKSNK